MPYDILSIVLDWLPTSSEILLGITCKKLLLDLDSRAVRFLNAGAEVKYVTRNGILKEGKLSAKETNKIKKDMLVLYSKDLPDLYVCFDKDCRTHLHPMTSFGRLGCWKSAGFIRYPPIFFHHVQAVMRPIHAARTTGSTIAIKLEQLPVVRDTWMTGSPADYRDELEARWDGIRRTETRTSFKIVQGRLLMKAEARQYRRWVGDSTTVDWKTKKTTPWAQLSRHGGCNHQYFVSQAAQASANSYEKEGELFMKTAKTYHRELRGRDEIEYMSRLSRCGWCAKEAQFDLRITADDLNWNIKLTTWTDLGPGLSPEDNPWKSIREDNKLHDPFGNISAPYLPHSVMHTQSIKESFEQVNEVRGQVLLHVGIPLMERGRDPVPQANWVSTSTLGRGCSVLTH